MANIEKRGGTVTHPPKPIPNRVGVPVTPPPKPAPKPTTPKRK